MKLLSLIGSIALASSFLMADIALADRIEEGKKIAFTRKGKQGVGNCIACHVIAGAKLPGNMGPPLVSMKQRFPSRDILRDRLYDPTLINPISAMPPFGKHEILTEQEIEKVIDYLYTL